MEEKRKFDPNYMTDSAVYFYTPRYYAFDNFSAFNVDIWGQVFPTAEHAYQWKKYSKSSPDLAQQVLEAPSAYATKKISDANKDVVDALWAEEKVERMEEIVRAKLEQHEKVKSLLLETEEKEIIENSPKDYFWGIGEDGTGENNLGKLWMKLRDEVRK